LLNPTQYKSSRTDILRRYLLGVQDPAMASEADAGVVYTRDWDKYM